MYIYSYMTFEDTTGLIILPHQRLQDLWYLAIYVVMYVVTHAHTAMHTDTCAYMCTHSS